VKFRCGGEISPIQESQILEFASDFGDYDGKFFLTFFLIAR
jgi:hypothetical protein